VVIHLIAQISELVDYNLSFCITGTIITEKNFVPIEDVVGPRIHYKVDKHDQEKEEEE
jgi:hypothetical protein